MEEGLSPEKIRSNRAKFLLIVALFVLPIGAALIMKLSGWRPQSTINHGTLVQPARPAVSLELMTAEGKRVTEKALAEKWNLVVVVEGVCSSVCEQNLFAMRQIHVAQGKNQHRVRRSLISSQSGAELAGLSTQYPELVVLTAKPETLQAIKNWTRETEVKKNLDGSRVFVVDPLGNFMMYYNPGFDPAGMRKDLARLLRVSHIG